MELIRKLYNTLAQPFSQPLIEIWHNVDYTQSDILDILVKSGINPNTFDWTDHTKLYNAVFEGASIDIIKHLLSLPGIDVNKTNAFRHSPLHEVRNYETAKLLIDAGANVNAVDFHGYTPLHNARDYAIIRLLVEAGANINANSHPEMTPIMVNKNTESFDYLASKGAVNNKGRRMFDIAVETGINESGCFKSELRKHSIRGHAAPYDTGKVNLSPC